MGRGRVVRMLGAVACVALVLSGCGGAGPASGDDGRLRIVTTVSPLTNIVANIAGDRAEVTGLIPEGTDSHTFEPPPSAARVLARADVLFVNGLKLEDPTTALAEANLPGDAEMVALGDRTIGPDQYLFDESFPEEQGKPNPHLWTNVPMAARYAEIVRDTLVEQDADNAGAYRRNHRAFADKLADLDTALRTATATLEPSRRKLLTYHDAYAYFAEEYGWTVIGAVQLSDFEDPSPRQLTRLIEQVRAARVPAVFGSEVFPSPVLEQIGAETGAVYVDDLRDDDLPGSPGDPEHTFLGLLRFDFVTIVEALGGDAAALRALDTANVTEDSARYPQ